MGNEQPALADVFHVLYRPRETMRRVLQAKHRWPLQIIFLAFVCSSVKDTDIQSLNDVLPNVKLMPLLAMMTLGLVVEGLTWIAALFIISWIAAPIGRMLGGTATLRNLRAALAWGMVPAIWSVFYRIPLTLLRRQMNIGPNPNAHKVLFDFISQGGCSVIVAVLVLQVMLFIWCLVVASCCVAEAQEFSTQKGFVNVVAAVAGPVLVIFAAIFTFVR